MRKFLLIILLGFILVGCAIWTEQTNIFENPVCEPPCWKNITPGITTKAEALAILSNLHEIDQPVVDPSHSFPGFDDAINFTLYKDTNKQGYLYTLNDQVSIIGFSNFKSKKSAASMVR